MCDGFIDGQPPTVRKGKHFLLAGGGIWGQIVRGGCNIGGFLDAFKNNVYPQHAP
jgi:hypothetical protein